MSKDFLDSLVTDDTEATYAAFESRIQNKLLDALEVRRVEVASSIMDDLPVVEEEVDIQELEESAARELVLHADNDYQLYRSSHLPIIKNLQRKKAKGIYDHEKATKLWGYHANRAAQSYHKAHGSANQKWHHMFSPEDRRKAAKIFADQGRDELDESVLPATAILKSAGNMERDAVNRYAKANKAIRNRDGLKAKMGKARRDMQKWVPSKDEVENMQNLQVRVAKIARRVGKSEADIWSKLGKQEEFDIELWEEVLNEVAAPGQEDWIKSNKKRFIKRYGKEKGTRILYAKAWKLAKEGYLDEAAPQQAAGPSNTQLHRNVLTNLRRAMQTLKIQGVNPQMAASAHKDFGKLVAKNPKAPGHMLLRKLSPQKAAQVQQLSQAGVPMGQSLEANPQDFQQVLTRMKRFR